MIPKIYQPLAKLTGPKLMVEFWNIFGTKEIPGEKSNPEILRWAKVCGLEKKYTNDGIAWCALTIAYLCHITDKPTPIDPLWALNWRWWGVEVKKSDERYGDVYITERRDGKGKLIGGHIGLIVGEDKTHFHIGGGNQSDSVMVVRFPKSRKYWCRRPSYINIPREVKKYLLDCSGAQEAGKVA